MDSKTVALEAARDLEGKSPQEILRWAAETFGDRFCVTSSMGDGVLSSLAAEAKPGIDVIFLDTGYHFPETIGTRDAVDLVYDVNVRTVLPLLSVNEQDAQHGADLWKTDPDRCCAMRKVEPLNRALADYDAYASGIRRDESATRADTAVVEWDDKRGKVKVNPIAAWTQEQVDTYIADNGVLVNPLVDEGYPSIGCSTCTMRVEAGGDPRSGRWAGTGKTECGLHT